MLMDEIDGLRSADGIGLQYLSRFDIALAGADDHIALDKTGLNFNRSTDISSRDHQFAQWLFSGIHHVNVIAFNIS